MEPTPVEEQKRAFTEVTTMVVDDTSAAGRGRAALVVEALRLRAVRADLKHPPLPH